MEIHAQVTMDPALLSAILRASFRRQFLPTRAFTPDQQLHVRAILASHGLPKA